jgi:hypothetical protein
LSHRKKQIVYKAMRPLKAVTGMPNKHTVIPAGAVLVWKEGDLARDFAGVSWQHQLVHVKEEDLFSHCEQITDDPGTAT